MIRLMIHTPVNLRGYMLDHIKNCLPQLEQQLGEKIGVYTPHDPEYTTECTEEWLAPSIEKGILPDVMITHATEFASVKERTTSGLFSTLSHKYSQEQPIRDEFKMFYDEEGIFYPIFAVPLVMIYNANTVDPRDLQGSWADIMNEKYKVIFPDRGKTLTRAVGGHLKLTYPEAFAAFEKRLTYEGTPASVIKAVMSGEYDFAITNSTFAEMAADRGIVINRTKEGYIPLPEVIVWKKGMDERAKCIADLMMDKPIQQYLADQGTWTGTRIESTDQAMDFELMMKMWHGWDVYLNAVAAFDDTLLETEEDGPC